MQPFGPVIRGTLYHSILKLNIADFGPSLSWEKYFPMLRDDHSR